jgi:3',5'-cyclic-AMP phosphodiesterase
VIPGETGGTLCEARLAWLETKLFEEPLKPTLIFMHHPPFATGISHMDAIALSEPHAFAHIVARHPQIERIVCGHVHRAIQTRFHGTVALTCPSTAHQIAFDLSAQAPAAFIMEPPGFMLHLWNGTTMVTHTIPIGDFAGPYRYHEE